MSKRKVVRVGKRVMSVAEVPAERALNDRDLEHQARLGRQAIDILAEREGIDTPLTRAERHLFAKHWGNDYVGGFAGYRPYTDDQILAGAVEWMEADSISIEYMRSVAHEL